MEVGFFDHVERRGAAIRDAYEARLRVLELADRFPFYAYHVAEHHGTPLSMSPSPTVLLSAIAERTQRIRFGPLCYILPLYNPLRLIEEVCMLDQLSNGRLEIGVGRGVSPIELSFFGVDPAGTRATFEEHLEVLLEGLTHDALNYVGKSVRYDEVPMELRPVQQPHPPFWYPTSGTENLPWVAAQGFWTVLNGSFQHVANQVEIFREHWSQAEPPRIGLMRFLFLGESDAEARRVAEPAFREHLANLSHLGRWRGAGAREQSAPRASRHGDDWTPDNIDDAVSRGWAAVGSPSTVAEQILAMEAATGCNYLIYNPLLASVDLDWALASVELFGSEVCPLIST